MRRYEGCFFFIRLEHWNLMITRENIYKRKHHVSSSGIDYLIYTGQRETIFWADVIQVGIINIDSPFTHFFRDHHHVCQPFRILYFPYKLSYEKFLYFALDNPLPIRMEASDFLSDRPLGRYNIELMRGY